MHNWIGCRFQILSNFCLFSKRIILQWSILSFKSVLLFQALKFSSYAPMKGAKSKVTCKNYERLTGIWMPSSTKENWSSVADRTRYLIDKHATLHHVHIASDHIRKLDCEIMFCKKKQLVNCESVKNERILTILAASVELRCHKNCNAAELFVTFRNGPVVQMIRFDWLLIVFWNNLCVSYTSHYQLGLIRARLRLVVFYLL